MRFNYKTRRVLQLVRRRPLGHPCPPFAIQPLCPLHLPFRRSAVIYGLIHLISALSPLLLLFQVPLPSHSLADPPKAPRKYITSLSRALWSWCPSARPSRAPVAWALSTSQSGWSSDVIGKTVHHWVCTGCHALKRYIGPYPASVDGQSDANDLPTTNNHSIVH